MAALISAKPNLWEKNTEDILRMDVNYLFAARVQKVYPQFSDNSGYRLQKQHLHTGTLPTDGS